MLVRIVPPYKKLADFLARILLPHFGYRHTAFLFHENLAEEYRSLGWSECYHMMSTISMAIDPSENIREFDDCYEDDYNYDGEGEKEEGSDGASGGDGSDGGARKTRGGGGGGGKCPTFFSPKREYFNERELNKYNITEMMLSISKGSRG